MPAKIRVTVDGGYVNAEVKCTILLGEVRLIVGIRVSKCLGLLLVLGPWHRYTNCRLGDSRLQGDTKGEQVSEGVGVVVVARCHVQ